MENKLRLRERRNSLFTALLIATPWLIEPAGGPTPWVWPWLVSMVCTALLLLAAPMAPGQGRLAIAVFLVPLGLQLWVSHTQLLSASISLTIILLTVVFAGNWIQSHGGAGALAAGWLAAGLLSSLIAICQYFEVEQLFAYMSVAGPGEVYANLRQRNQFASLTNIGLASVLFWIADGAEKGKPREIRWAVLLAVVLLVMGNALSGSRTGLLQLIILGCLAVFWGGWQKASVRKLLLTALIVYVSTSLFLNEMGDTIPGAIGIVSRLQNEVPECASRLTLWANMLYLISSRPWTGWGWGELDYAHFLTTYPMLRHCELLDNAHNLPLHLAVESGALLMVLGIGIFAFGLIKSRPWQESSPVRRLGWAVTLLVLTHSMLEYPLWFGPFQMALGLGLGLASASNRNTQSPPPTGQRVKHDIIKLVVVSSLLLSASYAAWDYHRVSQIFLPAGLRVLPYRENTLEKIRGSWLFQDQVRFAEYTITPLTQNNAEQLHAMGLLLLHYSPEARVVEKLIESAVLLGRDEEARFYLARYKAAYPQEHARWAARQREPGAAE